MPATVGVGGRFVVVSSSATFKAYRVTVWDGITVWGECEPVLYTQKHTRTPQHTLCAGGKGSELVLVEQPGLERRLCADTQKRAHKIHPFLSDTYTPGLSL